jgi:hypothetical protein
MLAEGEGDGGGEGVCGTWVAFLRAACLVLAIDGEINFSELVMNRNDQRKSE